MVPEHNGMAPWVRRPDILVEVGNQVIQNCLHAIDIAQGMPNVPVEVPNRLRQICNGVRVIIRGRPGARDGAAMPQGMQGPGPAIVPQRNQGMPPRDLFPAQGMAVVQGDQGHNPNRQLHLFQLIQQQVLQQRQLLEQILPCGGARPMFPLPDAQVGGAMPQGMQGPGRVQGIQGQMNQNGGQQLLIPGQAGGAMPQGMQGPRPQGSVRMYREMQGRGRISEHAPPCTLRGCCKVFKDASVQTSLTHDSISRLECLSKDFDRMSDADSDVEIHCEGQTIRAHKSVLCSRSPVLARMLQSDMVEGRTREVNIRDMDVDSLRQFLRYLYTGRLDDPLTFDAALSVYEAGDMYGVESLAWTCSQFLVQNLTVDNAFEALAVADAHNDEDFKKRVTQYLMEERIPQSGDRWHAFCRSHSLLAMEVLNRYVEHLTASEPPQKKLCV